MTQQENDMSLVVIEQREVEFYGEELTAVRAADGHIYVSVRHLCDALGLDRASKGIKRATLLFLIPNS
jgi:hypothetical protein